MNEHEFNVALIDALGGTVTGLNEHDVRKAIVAGVQNLAAAAGNPPKAAAQAASTATDAAGIVTDFNALLTKLKAAGLMSS